MIDPKDYNRISFTIPVLQRAEEALLREFWRYAFLARIPTGKDVFIEGDSINAIALLISGVVRVYKIGETGREITLYRFGLGESCILTANAILSQQTFPAIATVEQEAEAVMIPADTFRDWVRRYDSWSNFVFELLAQRLAVVMALVEEVVFRRMDARIAMYLAERGRSENPLRITHQEIASELGSSREVISRILEDFVCQEMILTGRGTLEILDFKSLQKLGSM
jgi:CRP/FNR family transcriptional regulator